MTPKLAISKRCRSCDAPPAPGWLDCNRCAAERDREIFARIHRMYAEDREPDDFTDKGGYAGRGNETTN